MKVIGQEGAVLTSIDAIEVTSENQEKLLEGMTGRAKVTEAAR